MHRNRGRRLCCEADVLQLYELLLGEAEEGPSQVALPSPRGFSRHREGCFYLIPCKDMDSAEVLRTYRSKNVIDKLFYSFKSEVEIKPVRVWTKDAENGVPLVSFIVQLMISLTRFFIKPVKRISTKFISASLLNLTLTFVSMGNGLKKNDCTRTSMRLTRLF